MQTETMTPTVNKYIKADTRIVNTVYETNNHDMFKKIIGNRDISRLNINRLKRSFAEKQLQVPLIVNELSQVIDGQHRLEVCRELGLPVHYIQVDGYTLEDVMRANSISRQWNLNDCVDSYCDLGNVNYKTYRDFKNKYKFGHCESQILIGIKGDNKGRAELFRTGNMAIGNVIKGSERAEMIHAVKPYYNGFKRRNFVKAMINLFDHPEFNHKVFIRKLSLQSMALQDQARVDQYKLSFSNMFYETNQARVDQYIQNIEIIYNYRNRSRVRFL